MDSPHDRNIRRIYMMNDVLSLSQLENRKIDKIYDQKDPFKKKNHNMYRIQIFEKVGIILSYTIYQIHYIMISFRYKES